MALDLNRDKRQDLTVQKWVDNKLKGIAIIPTGVGKTRIGLKAIKRFVLKNTESKVLIIVPNDPLKIQWGSQLMEWQLTYNCTIKTMTEVSRSGDYKCDLLIVDEIHKTAAPGIFNMYSNIKFKTILGLTATLERLDGKDKLITNICPIIDKITMEEAIKNKWISDYREYLVLIEPDDFHEYQEMNREFQEHFSYFEQNFELAMSCATDWKARSNLAKIRSTPDTFKEVNKSILIHAMGFMRCLQKRKQYINNHPKKIELAEKILENRLDKKCITFSNTIAMAEKIKFGYCYSGRDSKKKGRMTISEFETMDNGVLNTVDKVNEGLNIPDIRVAIFLGLNSSKTKRTQRVGRAIRTKEGKVAEIFYLVIKNSVEVKWFENSCTSQNYITIDEEQLENVLNYESFTAKKNKQTTIKFRF